MAKWQRIIILVLTAATLISILVAAGVTLIGAADRIEQGGVSALWSDSLCAIISLVVSTVALGFSFYTFRGIDMVSVMGSAEGNVLEDDGYSIAYYTAIRNLSGPRDRDAFADKVLDAITNQATSARTLVGLCDRVQNFMDNLIWVAYAKESSRNNLNVTMSPQVVQKLRNYLDSLYREAQGYAKLNSGIRYVLMENLGLIECVLKYLTRSDEFLSTRRSSKKTIADVRGGMIRNPVSQVVYYDYLGLHYLDRAAKMIQEALSNDEPVVYKASGARLLRSLTIAEDKLDVVAAYLGRAHENFENASSKMQDSLLWKSYIQYNECRAKYLEVALGLRSGQDDLDDLGKSIDEMYGYRQDMKLLIETDVLGDAADDGTDDIRENSYLVRRFRNERERADDLKEAYVELRRAMEDEGRIS